MSSQAINQRILMIGPLPPPIGGQSVLVQSIAESSFAQKAGLLVLNIAHYQPGIFKRAWLTLGFLVRLLRFFLTKNSIRLLHIHTSAGSAFWEKTVFIFLARLFGRQVVLHIHGGKFVSFWNSSKGGARRLILSALNACSTIIVLSNGGREFFLKEIQTTAPVKVLPNAVVVPERNSTPPCEGVTFLFVGHLKPEKGLLDLLAAFQACNQRLGGGISLKIMGGGDNQENEKLIRDAYQGVPDVTFLGVLTGEAKWREFSAADIFILPSHIEDMPITLLEAMSFGMPVLATTVGSIPEVVSNGINGLLTEPANTDELTTAMAHLVHDRKLRERMGRENETKARKKFSLERYLIELEGIYQNVLAR